MRKQLFLMAATLIAIPALSSTGLAEGNKASHSNHSKAYHVPDMNKPNGVITMVFHSADLGVGYTWGEGTLHFRGKSYKFEIKGGDVVALGFSKSQATGHVYNLTNLYDFAGKYGAASGEATAGVGIGGANLQNSNNVVIKVDTKSTGGRLAGAPGGFVIKFKDEALQKAVESRNEAQKKAKKADKKIRKEHATTDDLNQEQLDKMKK